MRRTLVLAIAVPCALWHWSRWAARDAVSEILRRHRRRTVAAPAAPAVPATATPPRPQQGDAPDDLVSMTLTAHDVHVRILQAASRQIATSDLARAIDAAGFGIQLRALVEQIAANAANPIACDVEDAVADAVAVNAAASATNKGS